MAIEEIKKFPLIYKKLKLNSSIENNLLNEIYLLRSELKKLVEKKNTLSNSAVIKKSQEIDKLLTKYYLKNN